MATGKRTLPPSLVEAESDPPGQVSLAVLGPSSRAAESGKSGRTRDQGLEVDSRQERPRRPDQAYRSPSSHPREDHSGPPDQRVPVGGRLGHPGGTRSLEGMTSNRRLGRRTDVRSANGAKVRANHRPPQGTAPWYASCGARLLPQGRLPLLEHFLRSPPYPM